MRYINLRLLTYLLTYRAGNQPDGFHSISLDAQEFLLQFTGFLCVSERSLERIVALLPRYVRPSVRPSVCLSGTDMHCDHTVHVRADLSLSLDSPIGHPDTN